MKILFDCTALQNWMGHLTGIQRVVVQINQNYSRIEKRFKSVVFDDDGVCYSYDVDSKQRNENIDLEVGDLVLTAGSNWDFPQHHINLMSVKQRGVLLGILFYDAIPYVMPHSYGPGFADIYTKWLSESLNAADVFISISENTTNDIIKFCDAYNIAHKPVVLIRLGDDFTESGHSECSAFIYKKCSVPYILSVGTLELRKNHIILLNAYRYLKRDQAIILPKLYLVGKKGWLDNEIEYQVMHDPLISGVVEVIQGVTDNDLKYLYTHCQFTLYPSLYEGWGLPVSESLCFGKQCVVSNTSSMLEIAPELTRSADPLLVTEWASHIQELSANPDLLVTESAKIKISYSPTTWSDTAKVLKNGLVKALNAAYGQDQS